jgi:hypothetical protein
MRIAALLLALGLAFCARATTPTTDFSDLWFNPAESGWGVNLIQQNEIIFLTMFVYGPTGQPTWFVGPATAYNGSSGGIVSFTGPLFTTTGPYFGAGTFNPSQVTNRQVGFVSFATGQIGSGAISYTVDGVSVTKSIERQTWRNENVGGVYVGGVTGTYAGCGASRNGYFEAPITLTVVHDGAGTFTMREEGAGYSCNYAGAYTQSGRMGQVQGSATCSDGSTPSFTASEVQGGLQGLTMRLASQYAGTCSFVGRIGGVRRAP